MHFLSGLLTYGVLFIAHIGVAVLGITIGKKLRVYKQSKKSL